MFWIINKIITSSSHIHTHMSSASTIGEIVELVVSSDKRWEDAAQTAVKEAVNTIRKY